MISRYDIYEVGCRICDARKDGTERHGPAHEASSSCESGSRSHCSCDRCF